MERGRATRRAVSAPICIACRLEACWGCAGGRTPAASLQCKGFDQRLKSICHDRGDGLMITIKRVNKHGVCTCAACQFTRITRQEIACNRCGACRAGEESFDEGVNRFRLLIQQEFRYCNRAVSRGTREVPRCSHPPLGQNSGAPFHPGTKHREALGCSTGTVWAPSLCDIT